MSDMEQSDVNDAPVAEPVAFDPSAAEPAVEGSVSGPEAPAEPAPAEPTAEKKEDAAPQPEPVPVISRTPSSENPTQAPEEAPSEDDDPVSIEDAALILATLVRDRRTVGDADVDAALADVEEALGRETFSTSQQAMQDANDRRAAEAERVEAQAVGGVTA